MARCCSPSRCVLILEPTASRNPEPAATAVAARLAALGVQLDTPLLLAFSGGRDSVYLAKMLCAAGFSEVTLAHLDHGLRPESALDAAWVQQFGDIHHIPVLTEKINVTELARTLGCGLEEAGREARYAFFAKIGKASGCARVLLAHHADDQVETFLFRLLRGSGANGLRGMATRSTRIVDSFTLELLRPILDVWRSDIDAFFARTGIEFREDASNRDPRWTRNRIRHELVPVLEQVMQRPVRQAVMNAADLLRAESDFVGASELALGPLPEQLEVAALRALPLALQRRRMYRWLCERGISNVSFELVESALALLTQRVPAKRNLPGGAFVRRRNGIIFCERG